MRAMNIFQKSVVLVLGLVSFSSCSDNKTTESVFPEQASFECRNSTLAKRYIVGWEDGSYSVEHAESDDDLRENFISRKLDQIKHIDRDIYIQTQQSNSEVSNQAAPANWGPEKIDADLVWAQGFKGQNIIVGVVDGYVDKSHVQLSGNVISAEQYNQEINNPQLNQHGTHVTGIIAADPRLGPISGVAPSVQVVSGQFLGNQGGGSLGDGIIAMNAVAAKGARIINLSWGGAPCADNLRAAMLDLSSKGHLLVTASGNEGVNSDFNATYPAAFNLMTQINVAASTIDDFLIYFSNRGTKTVQLAAPGVDIVSTVPGNSYKSMDGTSMAAPMVTGSAALIWSAYPNASAQQVRTALMSSVDVPINQLQVSTRGRLNVKKSLDALKALIAQ